MSLTRRSLILLACCLLVVGCAQVFGQATGSLAGTVSDKTGSVITGAKVLITSQGTGISREAKTDDSGHYLVPLLPVAMYTIRVEAQGFQTTEQKDVRLQLDEHREIDFMVSPASVTSTVEVSATEVAVQTTNPTLGQVITSEQVADLPLNGRNFVQLATLTPGTVQETNPNSFFNGGPSSEVSTRGSYSLSVGGSRAQSTDWLFDGNDNNELTAGGISILPSIDAIQEFKVLTYNYSAEYGTRAGPTVLVTTKSGSNQFHGSLFEFLRNTSLDASSFFAATKEKFNLNQFGGSLGGPIKSNKTFFFLDYQGRRQRKGVAFNGFVPTAEMRTGDFSSDLFGQPIPVGDQILFNPYSVVGPNGRDPFKCDGTGTPLPVNPDGTQGAGTPCNKLPQGLINPITQQMINLYPLPTPGIPQGSGFNFASVPVRKLDEGEFDVRVDHNFSENDSVSARFSYDQATNFVPGGSPGFAEPSAFASTQNITNHGRNAAISETHIFSPTNINQITFGFNRIFNHILSFGDRSCEAAKLGIPGANLDESCSGFPGGAPVGLSQSTTDCVSCGLTATSVGGPYWGLGDRGFAPFQGGTNVFMLSDSFDMIRGKHNIRVGGQIRAQQMNVLTNAFQDGFFVFTNLWSDDGFKGAGGDNAADFLLGLNSLAIHDQTFEGATTGRRWKLFRPYVQDDWRVTNNLTLNLGVAWAFVTPVTEAQNRQANFNFSTGKYLIPGQSSDGRVGIEMDKTGIEPRIGFAWKPFSDGKTVFRGGYAIFHDSSWNQGGQGLWENPPFFAESGQFAFTFGGCASPTAACAGSVGPFDFGLNVSNGFPLFLQEPDPASFQGTIQSQNLDFKQGRVQQFNLNIERELPGNVVLTTGYAGSRSHHILVDGSNLNVSSPSACGVVSGYTLGCSPGGGAFAAPYGPFTTIAANADAGNARYDSLQIKGETKSARHGLYALLGYTYARNFDSGFNDGLGTSAGVTYWPLPGNQRADWSLSQVQLNHVFTASVLYDLPFGKGKHFGSGWNGATNALLGNWQINVIQRVTSGFPVFLITSTSNSGVNLTNNGNNFNRPDQICNAKASNPTLGKWFNTQCFVDAPTGELGNAPRAPVYGPDFVNTDFSLIKQFVLPYRDGMRVDFRAEFFNLFNHPQFGLPGNDADSATNFGVITNTVNNPRLIQFGLKLVF